MVWVTAEIPVPEVVEGAVREPIEVWQWYLVTTKGGEQFIARKIDENWFESVNESGGSFTFWAENVAEARLLRK